ncbi:MAG: flagellar motor protein MotB [Phycisphaerae bacterium]|nr:OmpA family protein [Tepidisphaeraceae bacterium]
MARKIQWLGLAALSIGLTGCVTSTDKYNALRLENESLSKQLADAESKAGAERARSEAYASRLKAMDDGGTGQTALIANQGQQISNLQSQLADIQSRYEKALADASNRGPVALAPAVSDALTTFATQNQDIVDFDAARGMVKFKTDFTFALGSADLTPKAKDVIARFCQILNSEAAKGYELMVAGHTDSTPVSNPATKAKHPNNWYLSSHRAIAVGDQLLAGGVAGQRLAVTGYGEQRPISSNAAQNRRVEVMILPSTVRSTNVAKSPAAGKTGTGTTTKKPTNGLNKDTVAPIDNRPILNK